MKWALTTMVLVALCSCVMANDLSGKTYTDGDWSFTFKANQLQWKVYDRQTQQETTYATYPYRLVEINDVPYIEFGASYARKWLALYDSHLLILFDSENSFPYFFMGLATSPRGLELHHPVSDAVVSSELTEDGITYSGKNLGNVSPSRPWCEGVPGYGIGQTIKFYRPVAHYQDQPTEAASVILSNGFVSYDKPWLYQYNSRLKRIEITGAGHSMFVDMPDSPNPVLIKIPPAFGTDLTLAITDVYKGSHWQDTCVNFLMVRLY